MLKIFALVEAVADSRTTVLMTGESGTGKSLLARAVHHRSPPRGKPFVDASAGSPPQTQAKLCAVGREWACEPVGANETKTVDVRVILASNVDLAQLVAQQAF